MDRGPRSAPVELSRHAASTEWPRDCCAVGAPAGALCVGAAGAGVRREVGSSAWCALEVLATCPRHASDGAWLVRCSVRDLADRLGVATNTAQRALATLRKAALVSPIQGRGDGGRFGSGWYHLTIPPDVLSSQMATDVCAHVGPARVKAVIGEQLELLPSP